MKFWAYGVCILFPFAPVGAAALAALYAKMRADDNLPQTDPADLHDANWYAKQISDYVFKVERAPVWLDSSAPCSDVAELLTMQVYLDKWLGKDSVQAEIIGAWLGGGHDRNESDLFEAEQNTIQHVLGTDVSVADSVAKLRGVNELLADMVVSKGQMKQNLVKTQNTAQVQQAVTNATVKSVKYMAAQTAKLGGQLPDLVSSAVSHFETILLLAIVAGIVYTLATWRK